MALNKKDCIAAVKQAGASELEALDIVDMLLEQKARLKASGDLTPQNLSRAWSATAEGLARQRAIQRRRTALGLSSSARLRASLIPPRPRELRQWKAFKP